MRISLSDESVEVTMRDGLVLWHYRSPATEGRVEGPMMMLAGRFLLAVGGPRPRSASADGSLLDVLFEDETLALFWIPDGTQSVEPSCGPAIQMPETL